MICESRTVQASIMGAVWMLMPGITIAAPCKTGTTLLTPIIQCILSCHESSKVFSSTILMKAVINLSGKAVWKDELTGPAAIVFWHSPVCCQQILISLWNLPACVTVMNPSWTEMPWMSSIQCALESLLTVQGLSPRKGTASAEILEWMRCAMQMIS